MMKTDIWYDDDGITFSGASHSSVCGFWLEHMLLEPVTEDLDFILQLLVLI